MTKTIFIMCLAATIASVLALAWDIEFVDKLNEIDIELYCDEYVKPAQSITYHVKVHSELSEPFEGKVAVFAWHLPTQLLAQCLDKPISLPEGEGFVVFDTTLNATFAVGRWCAYAKIFTEYPHTKYAMSEICCTEIEP